MSMANTARGIGANRGAGVDMAFEILHASMPVCLSQPKGRDTAPDELLPGPAKTIERLQ